MHQVGEAIALKMQLLLSDFGFCFFFFLLLVGFLLLFWVVDCFCLVWFGFFFRIMNHLLGEGANNDRNIISKYPRFCSQHNS